MKKLLLLLVSASIITLGSGCAARASMGNRDQHGAGVSARTEGHDRGMHARVY